MIKTKYCYQLNNDSISTDFNTFEEALALAEDLFKNGSFAPYPEEIINAKYEINELDKEEAKQEKPFILAKTQDIKEKL